MCRFGWQSEPLVEAALTKPGPLISKQRKHFVLSTVLLSPLISLLRSVEPMAWKMRSTSFNCYAPKIARASPGQQCLCKSAPQSGEQKSTFTTSQPQQCVARRPHCTQPSR